MVFSAIAYGNKDFSIVLECAKNIAPIKPKKFADRKPTNASKLVTPVCIIQDLKSVTNSINTELVILQLVKMYREEQVEDPGKKLEKAVEISPDSVVLYFELARTYALNRDYRKAVSAYYKVVELNPDSTQADKALIEARKIQNLQ